VINKAKIIRIEKDNRLKLEPRPFRRTGQHRAQPLATHCRNEGQLAEGLSGAAVFHSVEPRVTKKWSGPTSERENE
jgi:hypothetical protein